MEKRDITPTVPEEENFSPELATEMREAVRTMIELQVWHDKVVSACFLRDLKLVEELWPGLITTEADKPPEKLQRFYDAGMRLVEKVEKIAKAKE